MTRSALLVAAIATGCATPPATTSASVAEMQCAQIEHIVCTVRDLCSRTTACADGLAATCAGAQSTLSVHGLDFCLAHVVQGYCGNDGQPVFDLAAQLCIAMYES